MATRPTIPVENLYLNGVTAERNRILRIIEYIASETDDEAQLLMALAEDIRKDDQCEHQGTPK